jgi:hypothetical protein
LKVSDFILETKHQLQEKSNDFWSKEEIFFQLQRAYIDIQTDMPYFVHNQAIVFDNTLSFCLEHMPLKGLKLSIGSIEYEYCDIDNMYVDTNCTYKYSFMNKELVINTVFNEINGFFAFKYIKELENENYYIELPLSWFTALRYLLFAYLHEKPTRNSKERNLSSYYYKMYQNALIKLKQTKQSIPKNIKSNYVRI